MKSPKALQYSDSHEWVEWIDAANTEAFIGITDFAQSELGDLVFVNLPEPGDTIEAGEPLGDVESVKAVSDIISPVTATVEEINEQLLDEPGRINENAWEAWFVKVSNVTEKVDLMDEAAYLEFTKAEPR